MDEYEVSPTGFNERAVDDLQHIEDALDEIEAEENQGSQEEGQQQSPEQQPQQSLPDRQGRDITQHPQYTENRLDIPYSDDEGKPGGFKSNPEIYDTNQDGVVDLRDSPYKKWRERKHALSEGGAVDIELRNAVFKGGVDLLSSALTARERYTDMITGEMRNVGGELVDKEGNPYRPSWDPLGKVPDPWKNSWWGPIAGAVTHYGIGGMWARRGLGAVGISGPGTILASEGIAAAVSEYSQDDNVTGQIVKKLPWTSVVFGALATKDDDHPLVLTFKNVLEEMGIGGVVDKIAMRFGRADYAADRVKNVDNQILEKGKLELEEGRLIDEGIQVNQDSIPKSGFRGSKNKPIADPWQGARTSTNTPFDIKNQIDRADDEWGTTYSGADSPFTEAQIDRMSKQSGIHNTEIEKKIKELVGDHRYKDMIKEARLQKLTPAQVFKKALDRHEEVLGRLNSGEKDIWKPITDLTPDRLSGVDMFPMEEIVAADLINGSLFKLLRNKSIAAREVGQIADVWATDGSMQSLRDNLIVGLTNVKRTRYLWGISGQKLKRPNFKKLVKERTIQLHGETEQAVDMMFKMLKNQDSDELAHSILEVFSGQTKIQNWMDFDAWMRAKLKGGDFDGSGAFTGNTTGVAVRELQGMFVNSILSGPKTPIRAIIGTTTNAYLNSVNTLIGAASRVPFNRDTESVQAAAQNVIGMFEVIPDAWKVMRRNMEANFSGDIATIKTRFSETTQQLDDWELMGRWVEERGEWHDQLAYNIANTAHGLNKNRVFTWSSRVLAATDDTFRYIMAKARSKELAFRTVMDEVEGGIHKEVTPELLKRAEDVHYNKLLDVDGNIDLSSDVFLETKFKEITLTSDLQGFSKKLEKVFDTTPWAKPFFLFARTGVNGLKMSVKNMPLIGAVVNESRDILLANTDNLDAVLKYGITSADDLAQAKNLIIGRQVMGNAVVLMAIQKKLAGEITGNGPANGKIRQNWIDTGWERNTISFGDLRVGYEAFEPYNLIIAAVSDVVDNSKLMGPKWTENQLATISVGVAAGITNKSYLQGLSQFVDVLSAQPGKGSARIAADLLNNTVPLAALRKEVAKVLNPYAREIGNNLFHQVRNRNLSSEWLTNKQLPIKYDILTGKPIKDWNIVESMWNATSPVHLSIQSSKGRTLLWNSNYDMRLSVYQAPGVGGPSLKNEPEIRSLFQKAIGDYRDGKGRNLEQILDALAKRKDIQRSVIAMGDDIRNGKSYLDPTGTYLHNDVIHHHFEKARKKAWASIRNEPEVQRLLGEHKAIKIEQAKRREQTRSRQLLDKQEIEELINPPMGK